MQRRRTDTYLPRVLHALTTGLSAAGAYLVAEHALLAGALTVAASVLLGSLISKAPPRMRRPPTTLTLQQLEKLESVINGEVHTLVNILATLSAELQLAIHHARAELATMNGEARDEKSAP